MKNILNRFLAILCLVVLGTGGAGAASDYYLSTGDLVRISVYDHPDLITETRVSENGSILFPLIGQVAVGGLTAHAAAGRIHTDFQRGFIRAEVIPFEDLEKAGSEHHAREQGLLRAEGRDYVVRDGDVIHFLFNV